MHVDLSQMRPPRGSLLKILAVVAGLTVVYAVVPLQNEHWWVGMIVGLVALGAITPFAIKRVSAISTSAHPGAAAVSAIAIVVAMLVLGFSGVYLALDRHHQEFEGLATKVDAVYFTVTTLSTVGYGDIHPVGQKARIAVTMQIIMDLSLIAVVVRVLARAAGLRRSE